MESWHSYPKVWALGHANLQQLFLDDVLVEEKVDGSQFSFGVFDGQLKCRSKGSELVLDEPEKMFARAVEVAKELAPLLTPGWTYRAEYLQKPKHNVLAYDRVPTKNVILFDVNTGHEAYLDRAAKEAEAARVGLEIVPVLHAGRVEAAAGVLEFLSRTSILGAQKIEGVVVKNYKRFGVDGKALLGKYVSEVFKETHAGDWRERNPNSGDIIKRIIALMRTPARWEKAVQHLREKGKLEGSPRDIGALIREAQDDLEYECADEIKAKLFDWAWDDIARGAIAGLPEWYKQRLLESSTFAESEAKAP